MMIEQIQELCPKILPPSALMVALFHIPA